MIHHALWPLRSLQARFLWATVFVIFVLMTAVIVMVEHRQRAGIIGEVERRGDLLTRNLAAASHAPLLLYHFTALEQNVARVTLEEDARYAIILDADGRVAAHSPRSDRVGGACHTNALGSKAAGSGVTRCTIQLVVPSGWRVSTMTTSNVCPFASRMAYQP